MKMWTEKTVFLQLTMSVAVELWQELESTDIETKPMLQKLHTYLSRATYDEDD